VVHALRYDKKEKVFVAKVRYKKNDKVVHEHIHVMDDWALDTYGKDIAKKLIDRGEHKEFVKTLNENGLLQQSKWINTGYVG
jgi:glycine cleavage system protein P-like pyridoxal-binding family